MQRTCKEFYIETPSPMIEILKGIEYSDQLSKSLPYRGFTHHRYFIWSNKNTIYCLPKYPIVEYFEITENFEKKLTYIASNYPVYWNNYIMCNDETKIVMLKNEFDFNFITERDKYPNLIFNGIVESMDNTNIFISQLLNMSL